MKSRPEQAPAPADGEPTLAPGPRRALGVLQRQPGATVLDVQAALGGHANTVRLHLESLVSLGLAVAEASADGPGRPAVHYRLSPAGRVQALDDSGVDDAAGARRLLTVLLDDFSQQEDATARARALGMSWGDRLAACAGQAGDPVDETVDLLRAEGYAPERDGDDLRLLRCPLLDAAVEHPEVVCAVHEGLIQGALDRLDGRIAVRLRPFGAPHACVAHLSRKDD